MVSFADYLLLKFQFTIKQSTHCELLLYIISSSFIYFFFSTKLLRVTIHNKLVVVVEVTATTSFLTLDYICGYAISLLIIFFKFQNYSITRYPAVQPVPLKHI